MTELTYKFESEQDIDQIKEQERQADMSIFSLIVSQLNAVSPNKYEAVYDGERKRFVMKRNGADLLITDKFNVAVYYMTGVLNTERFYMSQIGEGKLKAVTA